MRENGCEDHLGALNPRTVRGVALCLACLLVCSTRCTVDPAVDGGGSQDASERPDAGASAARDASVTGQDAGSWSEDAGGHDLGERTCAALPPTTDYGAKGPFDDVQVVPFVGPNCNYTLFRPGTSLGMNGFKHPIAAWGNGILTTPDEYQSLLTHIASHGFVIVACNDIQAERECLSAGLDWLAAQNDSGPMAQKLDVTREVTVGYSWGGGAAIDTANRPNVKATVSLQGMPPRGSTAFADMHSPLLLFTSTGDSFVTMDEYVTPNFDSSTVQTFYAVLNDSSVGHLYPVDVGAIACVAFTLGACGDAEVERAPTVAWLRMLACDDQGARAYFYGGNCSMCGAPWTAQKKNWPDPDAP